MSNFLSDYLLYSSDNEAPEMFHTWSGIVCLASAVSRRVWLPFGKRAIYPNPYVLLVGDAGNGKSIAMFFAKLLLQQPGLEDIPISSNIETAPGLLRFMGGNPKANPPIESPVKFLTKWPDGIMRECHPMTILANEFINFISIDPPNWMNMLNDISDQDFYKYRTKNQGEDVLMGPFMCLLGGLTTEITHDLQKNKIIASGFARRTIFQFGERRWHDPHAILSETPEQASAFIRCVEHLKKLRTLNGEFKWTPETQSWWKTWYDAHNVLVPKRPPQLKSWYGTKPDHVLRLSMLVALAESADLVLRPTHFEVTIALLEKMEGDLYRVFGGVGRNDLMPVCSAIYAHLCTINEPVSRKRLLIHFVKDLPRRNDMNKEFDSCIEILSQEGKVSCFTIGITNPLTQTVMTDTVIGLPEVIQEFAKKHGASASAQQQT